MTNEEIFLITVCDAFIWNSEITIPNDIKFKDFYTLAFNHNLLGVAHCAMVNAKNYKKQNKKVKELFLNNFFDLVYIHERQITVNEELKKVLKDNKIEYVEFKGIALKNIFPTAEARAMSDIDILIKPEKRDEVKQILIDNGFEVVSANGPVYNYKKDEILIEVHTKLLREYNDCCFDNPFDYLVEKDGEFQFEDEYHFAYTIAHIAHHFRFYGAGLKFILDLAIMMKNLELDMDKVFKYLESVDLVKFAKILISISARWFTVGERYFEDTFDVEDYLLLFGAFGAQNKNQGAILTRREMDLGHSASPFFVKLRLAFPSYQKMKQIDYVKFIEGRPWLLPWAWCYRFVYNYKFRRKKMFNAVNSIDEYKTQEKAKEEYDFFKGIGL